MTREGRFNLALLVLGVLTLPCIIGVPLLAAGIVLRVSSDRIRIERWIRVLLRAIVSALAVGLALLVAFPSDKAADSESSIARSILCAAPVFLAVLMGIGMAALTIGLFRTLAPKYRIMGLLPAGLFAVGTGGALVWAFPWQVVGVLAGATTLAALILGCRGRRRHPQGRAHVPASGSTSKRVGMCIFGIGGGIGSLLLATTALAARPWPDSTARTVVFADQLPGNLSATQRWFAATKLAGTQKMLRSEIQALRAYNTNFLCLHYQLAVGAGPAAFIVGNTWTSDWAAVSSHSNWFLINPATQRVHQTQWNWDLMDVTYSNGLPRSGFPQYWITQCLARIAVAEDDGVFADSFTQDAYAFGQCTPSHPWLESVSLCLSNWIPALTAFGTGVRQAFDADTNGFLFLPNLGGLINSWDTTPYGLGHGGMIEGFALGGEDNFYDLADWRLQMNRALALARSNKVVLAQTYTGTANYSNRLFALASYLLVRGPHTYLNFLTSDSIALEYYPEYTVDTGAPLAPVPAGVTDLWHAGWGVYRRDFSNAVVLVNPGSTPVTIASLGTNYLRVVASGGGVVNSAGSYGGTLSTVAVTGLTLAAHSGAVLLTTTNPPTGSGPAAQPAALQVTHRSGQSFITWTERGELAGERYRVYRHTAPVSATNRTQAVALGDVPEGSGRFYCNRYFDDGLGEWTARYLDRYVITPGGGPIADGTGMLVWTLDMTEVPMGSTGAAWYAVTTIGPDGTENTNDFSAGNTCGPVMESVGDPLPVLTGVDVGARGHLYIQYMDLRRWNATFHAPHERNGYYGLNPTEPGITNALQYAYDYVVYEPEGGGSPVPAYLNLHGWGGNGYGPYTSDPEAYSWPAYKIYPVDTSETWYFGFARHCDYRTGADPAAGDSVENYTEQRLLRMIRDLIRAPPGVAVDSNRVYVWGHSMGGSGALALALRYPTVFACAYASEPMTDYRRSGDGGGTDWRGDLEWKWGTRALNLPVTLRAPGGWADALQPFNGLGVWDWQNHRSNVVNRLGMDMVPIGIAHGTADDVIEWSTQGQPVYPAFNASRQPWGGAVTPAGHSWQGFYGCPPTVAPDDSLAPFMGFSVVRNETVPGLSQGSADAPLPPAGPGEYNLELEWSASWDNWDGVPVDTADTWRMSLRSLNGATQSVAVTPRRLQRFAHHPGAVIAWTNRSLAGVVRQAGTGVVDTAGLITVPAVSVTPGGSRVTVTLDMIADLDHDGMPDSWEAAYFTNGTTAAASGDADGDGALNGAEYDADTDPTNAASVLRFSAVESIAPGARTVLHWPGSTNRKYDVHYTPALGAPPFTPLAGATNLPGVPSSVFTDTVHGASPSGFYRLGVRVAP